MNKRLEFKKKVIHKMIAAKHIEGWEVTLEVGLVRYLLPSWIHKLHLKLLLWGSAEWSDMFVEIIEEMFNENL